MRERSINTNGINTMNELIEKILTDKNARNPDENIQTLEIAQNAFETWE
jgi:hypothetical protein